MLVQRRTRSVTAATAPSVTSGSGHCTASVYERSLPLTVTSAPTTTCSPIVIVWKPSSSIREAQRSTSRSPCSTNVPGELMDTPRPRRPTAAVPGAYSEPSLLNGRRVACEAAPPSARRARPLHAEDDVGQRLDVTGEHHGRRVDLGSSPDAPCPCRPGTGACGPRGARTCGRRLP